MDDAGKSAGDPSHGPAPIAAVCAPHCVGARVLLPILQVYLSGSVSSQYLTALLMAAPLATGTEGIEIIIKDELVRRDASNCLTPVAHCM